MADPLILIGASVRSAAFSALRAGLAPWCADRFGDLDLRRRCAVTVLPASDYPHGFIELLSHAPPGPWMYTGALENRRRLIRTLSRCRPLWGNDARSLALARSPFRVRSFLESAGLPCPRVLRLSDPPSSGRWLLKPRAGAAGVGIRFWDGAPPARPSRHYLQELIDGLSCSALYAALPDKTILLGVTRQLIGEPWLHAAGFRYCGSVGPHPVDEPTRHAFVSLGQVLARECGLRGLFGVDAILADGVPMPVEVNPRYTASVEVLEHATGLCALAWHRRAFDPSAPEPSLGPARGVIGKAIWYAPRALTVPTAGPWLEALQMTEDMPPFADIPPAGQTIEKGHPVLTLLVRTDTPEGCLERLREAATTLDGILLIRQRP